MNRPAPSLIERLLSALDNSASQPLYQQLQRALRDAIESHLLAADDALPSERQLAADLGV
jgi:GntR family transcriptional regulator